MNHVLQLYTAILLLAKNGFKNLMEHKNNKFR